jgi:hypothetical protein
MCDDDDYDDDDDDDNNNNNNNNTRHSCKRDKYEHIISKIHFSYAE